MSEMLKDWITGMASDFWIGIPMSTLVTYVTLVVLTRIMGLRSFSKMSGFDFAVTVAIGSVLASAILSPEPVALQAAYALVSLFAVQWTVASVRGRVDRVSALTDNRPRLLMDGQEVLYDNLEKSYITMDDLRAKLREANVTRLSQVRAVVFETTGDISVLHSDDPSLELEDQLLEGVVR